MSADTHQQRRHIGSNEPRGHTRVRRACDNCRRRKIKCQSPDMKGGTCDYCRTYGYTCTYGVAAPPKPLPPGYLQALEQKVALLQEELIHLDPSINIQAICGPAIDRETFRRQDFEQALFRLERPAHHIPIDPESVPRCFGVGMDASSNENDVDLDTSGSDSASENSANVDVDELSELFQLKLADFGNVEGSESYMHMGKTSLLRLGCMLGATAAEQNDDLNLNTNTDMWEHLASGRDPMNWCPAPWCTNACSFGDMHLAQAIWPPAQLATDLLSTYFAQVHHLMPIFQWSVLLDVIKEEKWKSHRLFARICLSVFAVAATCLDNGETCWNEPVRAGGSSSAHPRRHSAGWRFFHISARLGRGELEVASLEHLQLHVLECLFMVQNGSMAEAWSRVGQGLRQSIALGLHLRTAILRLKSEVVVEVHTRVFWCLVYWDRVLSAMLGRPLSVPDSLFEVDMPVEVDDGFWSGRIIGRQPSTIPPYTANLNIMLRATKALASAIVVTQVVRPPGEAKKPMGDAGQHHVKNSLDLSRARLSRLVLGLRPEHQLKRAETLDFDHRQSLHAMWATIWLAQIYVNLPIPYDPQLLPWRTDTASFIACRQASLEMVDTAAASSNEAGVNLLLFPPTYAAALALLAVWRFEMLVNEHRHTNQQTQEGISLAIQVIKGMSAYNAGAGKAMDGLLACVASLASISTEVSSEVVQLLKVWAQATSTHLPGVPVEPSTLQGLEEWLSMWDKST